MAADYGNAVLMALMGWSLTEFPCQRDREEQVEPRWSVMMVASPSGRSWPRALAAVGGPDGSQNNNKTCWTMQLCRLVVVWSQACHFISLLTWAESLSRCSSDGCDDWFFYSLFSTHLQHDWLLTPFLLHVWQSETLAHTRLHTFHSVWSTCAHVFT